MYDAIMTNLVKTCDWGVPHAPVPPRRFRVKERSMRDGYHVAKIEYFMYVLQRCARANMRPCRCGRFVDNVIRV
jgi:hypothetical protein